MAEKRRGAPTKEERLEKERAKIEEEKQLLKWKKSADELKALKDSYDALKSDYAKAIDEINTLKRGHAIYNTDENRIKKVLELRARGDDSSLIKKKIEYIGFTMTLNEIENLCKNIDVMPIEYKNYYTECAREYEKEVELNPSIIKRKNLENILYAIDETKKAIDICVDDEIRRKLFKDLESLSLSSTKILEGKMVTDVDSKTTVEITSSMDNIDKLNEAVTFSIVSEEIVEH